MQVEAIGGTYVFVFQAVTTPSPRRSFTAGSCDLIFGQARPRGGGIGLCNWMFPPTKKRVETTTAWTTTKTSLAGRHELAVCLSSAVLVGGPLG